MVQEILSIPERFYTEGNVSTLSLLKQSGYFEHYEEVTPNIILHALKQSPECIQWWIRLSDDKRTGEGWYLLEQKNGGGLVGYIPEGRPSMEFADLAEACAHFIKLEIEEHRNHAKK